MKVLRTAIATTAAFALVAISSPAHAQSDPAGFHQLESAPSEEVLKSATQEQRENYHRSLTLSQQASTDNQATLAQFRAQESAGSPNVAKFSEGVKCVIQVGPIDCYTARNDANTAEATAIELYGGSLHNGPGDAFRHCYWNALMAIHINPDQAKIVADNHEAVSNGPEEENKMDFFNNDIGRQIGSESPSEEVAKKGCQDAVNSKRLQLAP